MYTHVIFPLGLHDRIPLEEMKSSHTYCKIQILHLVVQMQFAAPLRKSKHAHVSTASVTRCTHVILCNGVRCGVIFIAACTFQVVPGGTFVFFFHRAEGKIAAAINPPAREEI